MKAIEYLINERNKNFKSIIENPILKNYKPTKENKDENIYNNLDLKDNIIQEKMKECKNLWSNGNTLKQKEFMEEYIKITQLKYIKNEFYNINGYLNIDKLKKSIFDILSNENIKNMNSEIKNLIDLLKIKCFSDNFKIPKNEIAVKNGLIYLNNDKPTFKPIRNFSLHLLNANYTTLDEQPKKWLNFLEDLLNEEDIEILQEYLGYCLIPSTDGQKCLFIVGKGGEGKSVIGKVLYSIFDNNMISIKVQKLLNNKFSLAQLKGKLVIFEDELQDIPLQEIDTFKSLITGGKFSIEEKYQREQQEELYSRFIILGNNILKHKNCKEPSFQRRLLLLITKDKDVNRVDNPNLANELLEEKDLIFMWLLSGLERLIKNNYQFSHKEYMKKRIENYYKSEYFIIVENFINDNKYIKINNGTFSTFDDIDSKFKQYCNDFSLEYNRDKFSKELSILQNYYDIVKERKTINGSQCWGYSNLLLVK